MGAALVLAGAAALVHLVPPKASGLLQTLGRGLIVAALVALPPASTHAFQLLNCVPTPLTPTAIRVMDGGPEFLAANGVSGANATSQLTVRALESDPFFVCWLGSHTIAGSIAAATLGLYVFGFTLLTFLWLWWDKPLREAVAIERAALASSGPRTSALMRCVARAQACCAPRPRAPPPLSSRQLLPVPSGVGEAGGEGEAEGTLTPVVNPLREAVAARKKRQKSLRRRRLSQRGLRAAPLPSSVMLATFLADYRPLGWYTRHLDMLLTITLSAVQAFLRLPTTRTLVLAKTVATVFPTLAVCAHVLAVRPFLPDDRWKGWVRALLLLLAMGCASISGTASLLGDSQSGLIRDAVVIAGIAGGTYALLVVSFIAATLLIVGVSRAIIRLAVIEEVR